MIFNLAFNEGTRSPLVIQSWIKEGLRHGFFGAEESRNIALPLPVRYLQQIHSTRVVFHYEKDLQREDKNLSPEGDAWVGEESKQNIFLAIRSADCFPVLLYDPVAQLVGAVHAGWRGAVGGVLLNTLNEMMTLGGRAEHFQIAIGPGAGVCCYQVGKEVADKFLSLEGENMEGGFIESRSGKTFADISRLLFQQAIEKGVLPFQVIQAQKCTICNDRYFSVRREGSETGRNISFIEVRKNVATLTT